MPAYDFYNEEVGETISVYLPLSATDKERAEQIVDGKIYKRVFEAPLAAIDSIVKDCSLEEFKRVTNKPNMKVGDMWKISAEMSAQRADKNGGYDENREKFYKSYEKKTGGKHSVVKAREAKAENEKILREFGIRIE